MKSMGCRTRPNMPTDHIWTIGSLFLTYKHPGKVYERIFARMHNYLDKFSLKERAY